MYCSFGERVTVFRKRNKYTRKHLAEMTGISSSTLTMYERDMAVPNAEHAIKLCSCAECINRRFNIAFRRTKRKCLGFNE